MKKIIVADTLSPIGHINYNKRILEILSRNYEIHFFSHYNKKDFEFENVFHYNLSKTNKPFKYINQISNYYEIKSFTKKLGVTDVFQLSYNNLSIYIMGILNKDFIKLNSLINHNNFMNIDKLIHKLIIKRNINLCRNFIVLEEFISNDLRKRRIESKKIIEIKHPLPDLIPNSMDEEGGKLKIVFIGMDRPDKGLDIFSEAIDIYKNKTKKTNLSFEFYGKTNRSELLRKFDVFENQFLSYDQYINYFNKAHFIILPYKETFNLRVSGVFLEAIALQKPVISTNQEIFKYNEHLAGGSIYLFEEHQVDSLVEIFEKLEYQGFTNYLEERAGMLKLSQQYDDQNIKKEFSNIIKSN